MIAGLLRKLETKAFLHAARKGGLRCPACGAPRAAPDSSPDSMLDCPECGARGVAREWVVSGGQPRGWADRPPADTRIQRKSRDDGAMMWDIPASGKSGGFLFFAIFWCGITAVVSGGFLMAFLFGEPAKGNGSVSPVVIAPFLLLFFGIFWAIGLGMLYVAVRNKWAGTRVVVTGDEVVLGRRLFGHVREKRLPRHEVTDVLAEEFYRSNEKPVYGVTIAAGKRKLKFGTMLREDEKGWLAADLRRVLCGEPGRKASPACQKPGDAESPRVASSRSFSLAIPGAGKHLWPLAVILTLMGLGFVAIGLFLIDPPAGIGRDASGIERVLDMLFSVVSGGFRFMWLLFSATMAAAGIWLWVRLIRGRGVERRLEGDALVVAIRKVKHGLILGEEASFSRGDVLGLSTSSSGHSNGRPMNRIELRLRDKSKTLAYWVEASAAEAFVASAMGSLWD